jgi:hypothetical protein
VPDHLILVCGGDDAEDRHVDRREPTVLEPQLDAASPRRLGGGRAHPPRALHQQVRVQRAPVVETQQQVFADGVGLDQRPPGEVEAHQPRVARDAPRAALAGEAAADAVGEASDRVALGHPTILPGPHVIEPMLRLTS